MSSLAGKVVLVTGGSSGIGRAASHAFARARAKVVLTARGEVRGHQSSGGDSAGRWKSTIHTGGCVPCKSG
jgi:NAD(P)-dependent dehydrogenase (short-subunit alcohol dehydrogenase family)